MFGGYAVETVQRIWHEADKGRAGFAFLLVPRPDVRRQGQAPGAVGDAGLGVADRRELEVTELGRSKKTRPSKIELGVAAATLLVIWMRKGAIPTHA